MANVDIKKENEQIPAEDELRPLFEWKIQNKPQPNVYFQVGALIFLLIVATFFFWQKNYFGAMAILMVIFLIFISQREKEEIYCAITKKGMRVKNELFPWENLESFWIFEDTSEIYLKNKKAILQQVSIPIRFLDAKKIRKLLLGFLPEKEVQRSLSEIFARKLGI
jgi:hypothetical protein